MSGLESLGIVKDREPSPRHGSVALVLGLAGTIAALLILPYALALAPDARAQAALVPLRLFFSLLSNFVVLTAMAWLGLRIAYSLNLDSPWIRSRFHTETTLRPANWPQAALIGVVAALAAIAVQVTLPLPVESLNSNSSPEWWKGLLASFYGGIVEETMFRLFLMSLLVWLATRIWKPSPAIYWSACVIAAILFGVAHLPNWSAISSAPVNPYIAASIIAANAVCGIAFGWLFWRRGLEHAIVAHFSTDIVLHVLLPLARAA